MTSRRLWTSPVARATAVAAVVGGILFIGTSLQPPRRGADYDDTLGKATSSRPAATRPRPDLPNYIDDPEGGKRRAQDMAVKSKGDFNRLDPEEQRWLNSVTAGHGAAMVRGRYAALAAQAQRQKQQAAKRGKPVR